MNDTWLKLLLELSDLTALDELLTDAHPGLGRNPPSRMAIVGASNAGYRVSSEMKASKIECAGIYDDSPERIGTTINGMVVEPFVNLSGIDLETPVVLATHRVLSPFTRLKQRGFACVWPFALLGIRWPDTFSNHEFYHGIHEDLIQNKHAYNYLYSTLDDDLSKSTLNAVIGFRLTLSPDKLAAVLKPDAYFARDLIKLSEQEVMIDGGAFSGDTASDFIRLTNGRFRRIYSFEPSSGSFDRLATHFSGNPKVTCVKACLFDVNTDLFFDESDSRDSSVSKFGESLFSSRCRATTIDSMNDSRDITFIRLNIEGAEPKAISGASMTIRTVAPKLAIAVYHRPDHLWSIANQVISLRDDYRLNLRQHDGGLVETVLYGVCD